MKRVVMLLRRYVRGAEWVSERVGHAVSWCATLLVLAVGLGVLMRYVLTAPWFTELGPLFAGLGEWARMRQVPVMDLQKYFFAILFLLAAAYSLRHDRHVRVDIIYGRLSERAQAIIDLVGTLLFLVPFSVLIIWQSWSWAWRAIGSGETAPDPGSLPIGWLKATIPIGFILLLLQGLAWAARAILVLLGKPEPKPPSESPAEASS